MAARLPPIVPSCLLLALDFSGEGGEEGGAGEGCGWGVGLRPPIVPSLGLGFGLPDSGSVGEEVEGSAVGGAGTGELAWERLPRVPSFFLGGVGAGLGVGDLRRVGRWEEEEGFWEGCEGASRSSLSESVASSWAKGPREARGGEGLLAGGLGGDSLGGGSCGGGTEGFR